MKPDGLPDDAPAAPSAWRKAAKVFAVLAIIAGMALISLVLAAIDDMCRLAGHRWSWLYTVMVVAAAGPVIILVASQLLAAFTSLSREQIKAVGLSALVLCFGVWAITIFAGDRAATWLGFREEPRGPAFCQFLRR